MKKKLLVIGIGVILLLCLGGATIVNIVYKNISTYDHTEIMASIDSPNEKSVATLFSYSTTTTPYRMGVSVLPKDTYNKIQKSTEKNRYEVLFDEEYNILLLKNIFDDDFKISWASDNKLEIKSISLNNTEINKIDNQSIDRKILKYRDIEIEYKE